MSPAGRYSRGRGRGWRRAYGREGGSSWLELALSIAFITVFAAVLLAALKDVQGMAERAEADAVIMNLRSALRLQVAERIVEGRQRELSGFPGANPVAWLEKPPAGYLGESRGSPAGATAGRWYFDLATRELVYVPRAVERFRRQDGGGPEVRWRVRAPDGAGRQTAGRREAPGAPPEGITIDITTPYAAP